MAASREELESLIRAADAAGDSAAVNALFDELDKLEQPAAAAPAKQAGFSPYKYYEPETQRLLGNDGSALRPLAEVAPGFNTGVAHLAGLPMTTLTNLGNLASAGLGYAQSKMTGKPPSPAFNPVNPSNVPLTGAWNERMLNKSPLGDVTSVRNPGDPVSRVVHSASAGIPGGMIGGGPLAPNAAAGVAGGTAGAVLNEAGADPATQAVGSLLAGYGAARMSFPPPKPPQAKPEPVPSTQELRQAKTAAYKAADDAGVVIKPASTAKVVRMIEGVAKKENLGKLPPKIKEAHDILAGRIKGNEPLSLAEADKVRQIISDAMKSQDASDVRLAAVIRKEYDSYLDNLSAADTLAGDGQAGAALLRNARELNRRFRNSEMVDEMLDKASVDADAKYTQAGLEHALRQEFKKLYKSDIDDNFLTPAQKAAVRRVAAPGAGANTLRNIGKLDVTRGGMSAGLSTLIGGGLGAAAGSLLGPAGAGAGALTGQLLLGGGAMAANNAALKGTQNRVNLAREALVGRGMPSPPSIIRAQPSAAPVIDSLPFTLTPGIVGSRVGPLSRGLELEQTVPNQVQLPPAPARGMTADVPPPVRGDIEFRLQPDLSRAGDLSIQDPAPRYPGGLDFTPSNLSQNYAAQMSRGLLSDETPATPAKARQGLLELPSKPRPVSQIRDDIRKLSEKIRAAEKSGATDPLYSRALSDDWRALQNELAASQANQRR